MRQRDKQGSTERSGDSQGYRRIREMLVAEGWRVNVKREGLKVPKKATEAGPPLAQRRIVRPFET